MLKCHVLPARLDEHFSEECFFYYHISLHYDERLCVCNAHRRMCEPSSLQTACCNLIVIQEMHAASHP